MLGTVRTLIYKFVKSEFQFSPLGYTYTECDPSVLPATKPSRFDIQGTLGFHRGIHLQRVQMTVINPSFSTQAF